MNRDPGTSTDCDQCAPALHALSETVGALTRQLAHARRLHEENCPVVRLNLTKSFTCSLCTALADTSATP